jgi:hypothetical protein
MTDQPGVQLDVRVHWCDRHLRPYKARWPQGVGVAMVALFQAAARMPAVISESRGDVTRLTSVLTRFAPLCCFVPREALAGVYRQSLPAGTPTPLGPVPSPEPGAVTGAGADPTSPAESAL